MSATTEINNLSINQVPPDLDPAPPVGGQPNPNPNCVAGAGGNIFNPNLFSLAKVIGILDSFHDFAKGDRVAEDEKDILKIRAATIAANLVCMPNELLAGLDPTGMVNAVIKYITNGQAGSVNGNYERGVEEVFDDSNRYKAILGQFKTTISIQEIIRSKLVAATQPVAPANVDADGSPGALSSKRPDLWKEMCGEYIPDGPDKQTRISLGPALTKRHLELYWDDNDAGAVPDGYPAIQAHTVINANGGQYMRILADFITKYLYPEKKGLDRGAFIFDMNSGSIGKIFSALPQINSSINQVCVSDSAPTSLESIKPNQNDPSNKRYEARFFVETSNLDGVPPAAIQNPQGGAYEAYLSQGNIFSWDRGVRFVFLNTDNYDRTNLYNFTLRIVYPGADGQTYFQDITFNPTMKVGPSVAYLANLISAIHRTDAPAELPTNISRVPVPPGHRMVNITTAMAGIAQRMPDQDLLIRILFDIKRCGDWEQSRGAQIASLAENAARGTSNTMFCTGDVLCSLFSRLSNGNVIWHNETGDGAMGWKISLFRTPNTEGDIPHEIKECIEVIRKSKTVEQLLDRICHSRELQSNFCTIRQHALDAITSNATYQINAAKTAEPGSIEADVEALCTQICRLGCMDIYFKSEEYIRLLSQGARLLTAIVGVAGDPATVCQRTFPYLYGLNYLRDLFDNFNVNNIEKANAFLRFVRSPVNTLLVQAADGTVTSPLLDQILNASRGSDEEKIDIRNYVTEWLRLLQGAGATTTIESAITHYVDQINGDPTRPLKKVLDALTQIPNNVRSKLLPAEGTEATSREAKVKNRPLQYYLTLGNSYIELIRNNQNGRPVFKNSWKAPWGFSFGINNLTKLVSQFISIYKDLTGRLANPAAPLDSFASFKATAAFVRNPTVNDRRFTNTSYAASYKALTTTFIEVIRKITFDNRILNDFVRDGFIRKDLNLGVDTRGIIGLDITEVLNSGDDSRDAATVLVTLNKVARWLTTVLDNGSYLSVPIIQRKAGLLAQLFNRASPAQDDNRLAAFPGNDNLTNAYRDLVLYSEYGNNEDANISEFKSMAYYAIKSMAIASGQRFPSNDVELALTFIQREEGEEFYRQQCNPPVPVAPGAAVAGIPAVGQVQGAIPVVPAPAVAGVPNAGAGAAFPGLEFEGGSSKKNIIQKGGAQSLEEKRFQSYFLSDLFFDLCGRASATIEPLVGNMATILQTQLQMVPNNPANAALRTEIMQLGNELLYAEIGQPIAGRPANPNPVRRMQLGNYNFNIAGNLVTIQDIYQPVIENYEIYFFKALTLYSRIVDNGGISFDTAGMISTLEDLQNHIQLALLDTISNPDPNMDIKLNSGLFLLLVFIFAGSANRPGAANNGNICMFNGFYQSMKEILEPLLIESNKPDAARDITERSNFITNYSTRPRTAFNFGGPGSECLTFFAKCLYEIVVNEDIDTDREDRFADRFFQIVYDILNHTIGNNAQPNYLLPSLKTLMSLSLYRNFIVADAQVSIKPYYSTKLVQLFLSTYQNMRNVYDIRNVQRNWYGTNKLTKNLGNILVSIDNFASTAGNFAKRQRAFLEGLQGGKKRKYTKKRKMKKKQTKKRKHNKKQSRKRNRKHKKTRGKR